MQIIGDPIGAVDVKLLFVPSRYFPVRALYLVRVLYPVRSA